MIRPQRSRSKWTWTLWLVLLGAGHAPAADLGEGTDLEIGGPGRGRGKFLQVMDITFDSRDQLHVLDGVRWDGKALVGNGLVQRFDNTGKFLGQFSVIDSQLGDKNGPARFTVDGRGHVFVTQPRAGLVQQYSPQGQLLKTFALPGAHAITLRRVGGRDQVVAVANEYKNNQHVEVARLLVIDTRDGTRTWLPLSRPVKNCQDVKADARGNLYLQAYQNQIYQFDPRGKLRHILGGGTNLRVADASELLGTVALDSKGNLYANTYGNPSHISRFNPAFTEVTQREGQFAWADAWGEQSLFAVDRQDRLWVAALGNTPGNEKYHYRPCVMRLQADFFDPGKPSVHSHSTRLLGLHLAVENRLPYGISYELGKPTTFELVVKASNRQVHHLDVKWIVHDLVKNAVAQGKFELPLQDGREARHAVPFTPARWGWYTVTFETSERGKFLMAVGRHLGVTPKFPGMPVLSAGESPGGWDDAPRQAFAGLPLQRVHTGHGLDKLEKDVRQAARYGLTLVVQFENQTQCAPERVREVVTRFKGRVKYWEVMNEPNLFMSPEHYVKMLRGLYRLIKRLDPQAQVLGPTVCGIQLPWYEAFYKQGGKDCTDIISLHDYEGNEAIDPGHWTWKIGELRKIMAMYGDASKPLWQTERAIGGVRAENFIGGVQAVRVTLQRDVLETLGIPAEHNLHYYLNQAGYGTVPTYLWSDAGPHPGALATRTRQAMIHGRKFAGTLNFGPTGNKIFLGLRYEGANGRTITLRNLGTQPRLLEMGMDDTNAAVNTVTVVDSFGNERKVPVKGGKIALEVSPLPIYLRLESGQKVIPWAIDFGRNYASQLTFTYSARHSGNLAVLNNHILEAPHPSNPHREPWSGDLPSTPQTLEMTFPHPRTVNRLVIFSVRADNPYCALLDYDLQYHDGKKWVTLQEVRSPLPASNLVNTPQCKVNTWYLDENFFINEFKPVTTDRLRLVVRRTTHGFMIDPLAVQAAGWSANAPHLMLREIEIYGPRPVVDVQLLGASVPPTGEASFKEVFGEVLNRSSARVAGRLVIRVPDGWKATPASIPVRLRPRNRASVSFSLAPVRLPAAPGPVAVDVTLVTRDEQVLDFDRLPLEVPSPVVVTPRPPARIELKRQQLPLQIRNVSRNRVNGSVEVVLKSLAGRTHQTERARATFGSLAPGEAVTVQPAAVGLDLLRTGYQAMYTVTVKDLAVVARQELLQVRPWNVLGPFPNLTGRAFDKDYGPEKGVELGATYRLPDGKTIRWKPALSSTTGFLDLNRLFKPNILVCAYAAAYVKSPTARKALVSAGSDDGGKTWLNGQLILSKPGARSAAPGQDKAAIELKAGWNEVLIKIPQSHGGWGFYFDILTPDGKRMPDVRFAASKGH